MTTNASREPERSPDATDRRVNPQQALATAKQANEPLIFGDLASDVPLMVGALAVDRSRPPAWERHDHGDELLLVLSGRFTMALCDAHGRITQHEAGAGDTLLIPRGSAHRAILHDDRAEVFFLTPRSGSREWRDGETPPEHTAEHAAHEPYAVLMRYKRWADDELLTILARPEVETSPQADVLREIVGHFHVVDRIFQAHLQGVAHAFTSTRLPAAPSLTQLRDAVAAVDAWYVDYADGVARDALLEERTIRFTDGSEKVFTRAEMLLHVSHHGTYHRGNAGVLLRMIGTELPADRFIDFIDACAPHR